MKNKEFGGDDTTVKTPLVFNSMYGPCVVICVSQREKKTMMSFLERLKYKQKHYLPQEGDGNYTL